VIDGLNQAAVIKGVDESGKLILVIKNEDQFFDLKEVAWLY
jgi:nitrate reductase NapAB chaperone NapD